MSNYFVEPTDEELDLAHHGILGQRWGIRRYQNADGSLTDAGLRRYGSKENFNKIQRAKADAEVYKIRAKAQLKVQKAVNKEELKRRKRESKIADKDRNRNLKDQERAIRQQEKSNKETQKMMRKTDKFNKNYQNNNQYRDNRSGYEKGKSATSSFAKSLLKDAVQPAFINAGGKALNRYLDRAVDSLLTSDADRALKKTYKDLERITAENDLKRAKIDRRYLDYASDPSSYKPSSIDTSAMNREWQAYKGSGGNNRKNKNKNRR